MQEFYFQVLITTFAALITGFIGWMSLNTWKAATKISSFEREIFTITADITSISDDIKALRKYDAQIAVLNAESANIKADIVGILERLREIETSLI